MSYATAVPASAETIRISFESATAAIGLGHVTQPDFDEDEEMREQ